jgi:hypothetical protein
VVVNQIGAGFHAVYQDLELRWKAQADAEGRVYLPNAEPSGPVDYLFIDQEPSFGSWALDTGNAKQRVEAGFLNYVSPGRRPSLGNYAMPFAIQHYLCEPGQQYFITDISKGAMLVEEAKIDQTERWDRWYSLLLEEVRLVAKPGAPIFAFGKSVEEYLVRRRFPRPVTSVLHYSPLAASHRDACVKGREESFRQFKVSISPELLLATAKRVLQPVSADVRDYAVARLARTQLSESALKLIFCYKLAFERYKMTHPLRT